MTRVLLIKSDAAYEALLNLPSMKESTVIAWARSRIGMPGVEYVCVTNNQGEQVFAEGDPSFKPKVWTHRPFRLGMPALALQEQFETKHVQCLADHDQPVCLKQLLDGRYEVATIRSAWMVYVELAIEHFNTSL